MIGLYRDTCYNCGMNSPVRRASLDQFRGYTVLGMIAANFLQDVQFIVQNAPFLRHAEIGFGYADSIMPQFFSRWVTPIG